MMAALDDLAAQTLERRARLLATILVTHAPPILSAHFRTQSCIGYTAFALAVAQRAGVPAREIPVTCAVFNPAMTARLQAGAALPRSRAELLDWEEQDGSYSLGIGFGGDPRPGKWPGHLALLIGEQMLVDLSLAQANRDGHHITLGPLALEATPAFIACESGAGIGTIMNDCLVYYEHKPGRTGYVGSADWTKTPTALAKPARALARRMLA